MNDKIRVLMVDDDVLVLSNTKLFLECDKFMITTCEDVKSAETELAKGIPDIILLDIMLPDRSGYDFCIKVKAHSCSRATICCFPGCCSIA